MMRGSWLQLIVLRVLYEQRLHGYKLLREINMLLTGRKPLKLGSLYTMLRRMEHAGVLKSTWEYRSRGLNRRIYALTSKGHEMLRSGQILIREQRKILDEMLTFYQHHFNEANRNA
jgi:DNA-binding PadR family transcriptional regulator